MSIIEAKGSDLGLAPDLGSTFNQALHERPDFVLGCARNLGRNDGIDLRLKPACCPSSQSDLGREKAKGYPGE